MSSEATTIEKDMAAAAFVEACVAYALAVETNDAAAINVAHTMLMLFDTSNCANPLAQAHFRWKRSQGVMVRADTPGLPFDVHPEAFANLAAVVGKAAREWWTDENKLFVADVHQAVPTRFPDPAFVPLSTQVVS